jgi:hypothetical protein
MLRLAILVLVVVAAYPALGADTTTAQVAGQLGNTYAATAGERGLIYYTLVGIIVALLIRDFLKDRAFRMIGADARLAAETMSKALTESSRRTADAVQALLIEKAVESQNRANPK